jgi:hypothetical protein
MLNMALLLSVYRLVISNLNTFLLVYLFKATSKLHAIVRVHFSLYVKILYLVLTLEMNKGNTFLSTREKGHELAETVF